MFSFEESKENLKFVDVINLLMSNLLYELTLSYCSRQTHFGYLVIEVKQNDLDSMYCYSSLEHRFHFGHVTTKLQCYHQR